MTTRIYRVLILSSLAICGCFLFFRAQARPVRFHALHSASDEAGTGTHSCEVGSDSSSCTASPVEDPSQAILRTGAPGHHEYPSGFEQFDTSDPKSPYRQDMYGSSDDENERVVASDDIGGYLAQLKAWTPYSAKYTDESHNPVIWQTYKEEPADGSVPYRSWVEQNKPKWSRTFVPQTELDTTITRLSGDLTFLKETFDALPARVLQLDFLRYLKLFSDGGVYADVDTSCYAPIDSWYSSCYTASTSSNQGERIRASQPGMIVGVEFDLQGDTRIPEIDGRQIALANYVFAANKGHPVLAKTLNAIVLATEKKITRDFDLANTTQVHEWTGRSIWTDVIVAHIQEGIPGFKANDLLGLKKARMFGDVCILPVSAFGSGQLKYKNSPDSTSEGVMVSRDQGTMIITN